MPIDIDPQIGLHSRHVPASTRQRRYEDIREMAARGTRREDIARDLGVNLRTVERALNAGQKTAA